MAIRNNIGKTRSSVENISRQVELFYGITQYGLGDPAGQIIPSTGDDVTGDEPNKNYLWGIHRWGTSEYKASK